MDLVKEILRLERECFKKPWESLPRSKQVFYLIEEKDGKVVGYLIGRLLPPFGEVLRLGTARNHRRSGVAKGLMERAMELFRKSGVTMVYLEVKANNEPAIKLYEKLGFERTRVVKGFYSTGEDAICMKKVI